jgi:hypothetical protein
VSQAPTSNTTITSDSTQSEKARVIKETNTRVAYARVVDPQPQGRWAKSAQSSSPATWYPPLPENNPWAADPVGPEPPLGVSVDELIPCGDLVEPVEIAMAPSHMAPVGLAPLEADQLMGPPTQPLPSAKAGPSSFQIQRRKFT